MPDTRRYTISLSLEYAEALQDALYDAYGRAEKRSTAARQRAGRRTLAASEREQATEEHRFARKSVEALAELMKAVGQHI